MNGMKFFIAVMTVCLTSLVALKLQAQALEMPIYMGNYNNVVGVAGGTCPDYEGSNDYIAGGALLGKWMWPTHQQFLLLKGYELEAIILDLRWLRMGPSFNYRFARDDVRDHYVDKMQKIDSTVEGGGWFGV
jgi:outer membrane scaffolding protein for murein synthesis (MipA/OmpV family)